MPKVTVIAPDGESYTVEEAQAPRFVDSGFTIAGRQEEAGVGREAALEEAYGDSPASAFALGAARGLTLGASDVALTAAGVEPEALREIQERAPIAGTAGEVTSSLAAALATGGSSLAGRGAAGGLARGLASTPAGAASRLGQALAARGAERGIAGRAASAATGGAVEGALFGAGQGVSELALSDDPLTAERAASVLSSKALYGAGIGATAGAGVSLTASGAERGLARAKQAIDDVRARSAPADGVAEDLTGLDRTGLRQAKQTELERLGQENVQAKAQIADEIRAYDQTFQDSDAWLAVESGPARAALRKARVGLRRSLDEPVSLAENPRRAIDSLRREVQALKTARAEAGTLAEKIAKEEAGMAEELGLDIATLPDSAKGVTLTGKAARRYADWAGVKTKKTVTVSRDTAEDFRRALAAGEIQGQRAQAITRLDDVIAQNEGLQARILGAYEAPKSPRLEEIESAMDALSGGGKRQSLGQQLLQGAVYSNVASIASPLGPLAPILGAKVADAVSGGFGGLARASTEAADRVVKALDRAVQVAKKAERPTVTTATKVLQSVSYGPQRAGQADAKRTPLHRAFADRESELLAMTSPGPTGPPAMRPEARRRIAEQLAPVAAASPILADRLETVAARRVEFLASKLPKRPDAMALKPGPDTWSPSDFEMRQFARYAAAVEDPYSVLERVGDGTVTPEDAEALRMVYPEVFADAQAGLLERLSELQENLPYARRLSMSILFGVPVDPSMAPEVIAALQANYTAEPGSEGGSTAPRPQPQFGSISKPEPTRAQERAS